MTGQNDAAPLVCPDLALKEDLMLRATPGRAALALLELCTFAAAGVDGQEKQAAVGAPRPALVAQMGHRSAVFSVALSADRKWIPAIPGN
jgi:hypothetical protein